jgi:hypothetical protein
MTDRQSEAREVARILRPSGDFSGQWLVQLKPVAELDLDRIRSALVIYEEDVCADPSATLDALVRVDVLLGMVFDRTGQKSLNAPFLSYARDFSQNRAPRRGVGVPVEQGADGILRIPWGMFVYAGPKPRPNFVAQFDYERANRPRRATIVIDPKPPNQSSEPTATGVTPPAGAGDRAAGSRGSP